MPIVNRYGLTFDRVESPSQQRQLRDFMLAHPGGYPMDRHEPWVIETCMPGIEDGSRRALAWWQDGRMIGDIVLKLTPDDGAEFKHVRMAGFIGRGAARFMVTQGLHEASDFLQEHGRIASDANTIRIILDTFADGEAEDFFAHMGFRRYGVEPLYDPNVPDALMERAVLLE